VGLVAAVVLGTLSGVSAQSASPIAIYVPASSTSARDYAIEVDGTPVTATAVVPGPHALSLIVLHDASTSMQPVDLEGAAREISRTFRAGDRIRLASFADRIVIGSTAIVDRASATAAAREVKQLEGASPLWDAICDSVAALEHADGLRAIVVFSDGQASANDRGFADALHAATRARVIVSVVGMSDRLLRVPSDMEVHGRNDALRRIADETGGEFVELRSVRSYTPIGKALQELRDRVRLEFVPAVRNGALHRVSVTARGRKIAEALRLAF